MILSSSRSGSRRAVTLIEMLVAVALTVLIMSILAEVFVLAGETFSRLKAVTNIHQKVRYVESVIRTDLGNRTIRQVQPPVEVMPGLNGILGDGDDFILPVGIDPKDALGYFTIEEHSPADAQGEDTDDVLAFTMRLRKTSHQPVQGIQPAYYGRCMPTLPGADGILGTGDDIVSIPDRAFLPDGDGLCGSDEAEVILFLREGTLYRRVLLVGVPQPSRASAGSWYSSYDISARPRPGGGIPVANSLGDLTYRSNRYMNQLPAWYAFGNAPATIKPPHVGGLDADFPGDPNFPFLAPSFLSLNGNEFHDASIVTDVCDHNRNYPIAISTPEDWYGRPTLRETSDINFDYPNNPASVVFTQDPRIFGLDPPGTAGSGSIWTRPAEDALLTDVISFDVKVFDPDATPNPAQNPPVSPPAGAFVDLGKASLEQTAPPLPSYTLPGPYGSSGTPAGIPGGDPTVYTTFGSPYPRPGIWPPARPLLPFLTEPLPGPLANPGIGGYRRGFGMPFGSLDPAGNVNNANLAIPSGAPGLPTGMLRAPTTMNRMYDTWCSRYTEPKHVYEDLNTSGAIDVGDAGVRVAPPYIVPVRALQIKIRFVDPESRLTREITIVQELE